MKWNNLVKNVVPKVIWNNGDRGFTKLGPEILGTCQLCDNTERKHGELFRFLKMFLEVQSLIFKIP